MNQHEQFIQFKEQSKEGIKAFGCLLGFIFICAVSFSLVMLYADKIDAIAEKLITYLNAL